MKTTAMLDNIQGQPESLRAVSKYQFGSGAEALGAAAAAIRAAGRVVFAGMGGSLYASMSAAAFLTSRGFPALAADASELLHFGGETPHPGAAMVLVSRSGESVEVTKLLACLGPRTTVGVTNVPGSSLACATRWPLHIHSAADRMVAVQTYTATAAVLLLLAAAVLETPAEDLRRELDHGIAAMSLALDDALASQADWRHFLAGAEVVHVLGRGPSLASAHAGALLFNEAARLPSAAMSAALFRHGPVEVVDRRFRAIVFASQPATRELDLALARELQSMGGGVRVCDAGLGSIFAPIAEIVPVQVAAYHLALDKGLDPGDFRHAAMVTLEEAGFQNS